MSIYDIKMVPCFVCEVEDELKAERGSQSHPIHCGWRRERERAGYVKALEDIHNVLQSHPEIKDLGIQDIVINALVARYDIKGGELDEDASHG